ncbi:tubulin alpha-4A chain isoform X2 [Hermetia illucens]|uniref:tubulin alpha-4A chain isoform X2 n=1 Tax=Hermetia illucens TaxID=343691 RepID=UPI0018CC2C9C|nr:tubulin alpha-4A chain isoform X2 [Hermetia illucens]
MCTKALVQLHIGQAGVQMANACWELYCLEHGITSHGCSYCNDSNDFCTFFEAGRGSKVVPRTVLVDTEPTVIDEIRGGAYRFLFSPDTMITGKTDAASNFAKGYYLLGNEMIDITMDTIRKVVEKAPSLQGFLLFHSIGGGTGSGFGTKVLEYLDRDYGKRTKMEFVVFPSPKISPLIVEPYNAILATHSSMEYVDCSILMDNEACYEVCDTQLHVEYPTYTNLNRIIAQVKCNPASGKYMSCVLLYRGDVTPLDINNAIQDIKSKKSILFVDWSPTGFKTGLNYQPPACVPGGDLAPSHRAVCMLSNSTSIRRAFSRIVYKFDNIMSKRGFVHHFVGAGLEEGVLTEARDDICALVSDYKEIEQDESEE